MPDELPYRERVEMYPLDPTGKLYSGVYDTGDIGVFGGGIDPGEDPVQAAVREMAEESGRKVHSPTPIPIDPFILEWNMRHKGHGSKTRERAKQFRGSRTRYVAGILSPERVKERGDDTVSGLRNIRLRSIDSAIRRNKDVLRKTTKHITQQLASNRIEVLNKLKDMLASGKIPGVSYRDRVEVYGLTPKGKVLSGLFSGGDIGGFGGGIDPGEDVVAAGAREMAEESGRKLLKPFKIPVDPLAQPYSPPYKTKKEVERAKQFFGHRTFYVGGLLGGRVTDRGDDIISNLSNVRLRKLDDAIALQAERVKNAPDAESKQRWQSRLDVLKYLRKQWAYDPPMSVDDIKAKGMAHLLDDPVHKWRAESGIEMVHKEPTLKELMRIWHNWQRMTPEQKAQSDEKSKELFGMSNAERFKELLEGYSTEKSAAEFAPGLPDPRRFGQPTQLPLNKILKYVVQSHKAQRAGQHYDIRFGPDQGHKPTLLSWATRKLPAEPGEKRMVFQQPLHTGAYADFEGEIVSGYGKGTVKTHDKGAVMVTKVSPNKISFVVLHKKHPETFTLVRKSGRPITPKTAREARSQGGTWLMINTTPKDVIKHNKVHYAKVPAADVAKLFDEEYLHGEKIDGAAALYRVLSDRIEVLSYRPTTAGRPIIHTYRVGGTSGVNIPKHLVGSVLRGELYGVRKETGRAIPPQELGGILNASTLKSLQKQQEQGVELRSKLFNILQYGQTPVSMEQPLAERMEKLKEITQYLPEPKFSLPEMAATPEEQKDLWERVSTGKHPLTSEGIVAWPKKGGKPTKVKLYDDHDVFVREIFPGAGKLEGVGAGGFEYSLEPEGDIVGKVGTGFSEATRKQMWETPEEFKGRVARIKAQGQFPSGAYRAPAFLSLHEDYPAKSASVQLETNMANTYPASLAAEDYTKAAYADPQLLEAYEAMRMPTHGGAALSELASNAAMFPALGAAKDVAGAAGRGMLGLTGRGMTLAGRGAKALGMKGTSKWLGQGAGKMLAKSKAGTGLAGKIAGRFAPKMLGKNLSTSLGSAAVPLSALMEVGFGAVPAAFKDPRYKSGQIGLARAVGGALHRSADAAQAKTQDAFRSGKLSGALSSALGGLSNPVATTLGFGKSVYNTLASPYRWLTGKSSSDLVLAPIIKQAVEQMGGEGNTLDALVKTAQDPLSQARALIRSSTPAKDAAPAAPAAPAAAPVVEKQPVTFGNRIRGLLMGVDAGTLQSLQRGAKSLGSVLDKLRSVGLLPGA